MKVECYRKRLWNKIKYFVLSVFNKEYVINHGKEEMIQRWHANPMTFLQDCYGSYLSPLQSLNLRAASAVMKINEKRGGYGRK